MGLGADNAPGIAPKGVRGTPGVGRSTLPGPFRTMEAIRIHTPRGRVSNPSRSTADPGDAKHHPPICILVSQDFLRKLRPFIVPLCGT